MADSHLGSEGVVDGRVAGRTGEHGVVVEFCGGQGEGGGGVEPGGGGKGVFQWDIMKKGCTWEKVIKVSYGE